MSYILKVRKIVSQAANQKSNIFDKTGYIHVEKVVEYAEKLAKLRKVDIEMIVIAAWLHDYATFVSKDYINIHEAKGSELARSVLKKIGYPQEKIEIIKDAIYCHRGSKNLPKTTLVSKCLADADAMAHFSAIPSLFYLAYVTYKMKDVETAKDFVKNKLARSWAKISPDARKLIEKEYNAAKVILNERS